MIKPKDTVILISIPTNNEYFSVDNINFKLNKLYRCVSISKTIYFGETLTVNLVDIDIRLSMSLDSFNKNFKLLREYNLNKLI